MKTLCLFEFVIVFIKKIIVKNFNNISLQGRVSGQKSSFADIHNTNLSSGSRVSEILIRFRTE